MSKPDHQLTLIEAFRYFAADKLTEVEAESQVKDLFLELIDRNEDDPGRNPRWQACRNELRAELRRKVVEL